MSISQARREYIRAYQRTWIENRIKEWINNNGPCKRCGSSDNLELDHIDPTLKTMGTAHIFGLSPLNNKRADELGNCQVLCYNCHKLKSNLEQQSPIVHGTRGGYKKGCRCLDCSNHQKERMKKYRRDIARLA